MPRLVVDNLAARHGLLPAVSDVSFALEEGEVVALIGANGAGKTTLLRTIAGAHPAAGGRVLLDGADLAAMPAHRRVGRGIALVPEGRRLFAEMSVEDNLRLAVSAGRKGRWSIASVMATFPQLDRLRRARAGTLSGGEQQAVAIARALLTNPTLLLLDEASLGLSPRAVDQIYASLREIVAAGTTMILVEQDLGRALGAAGRVLCLRESRIVLAGPAAGIDRARIMAAYFGAETGKPP
jgi:branched-chain amino acid transport system ATP-binding protein